MSLITDATRATHAEYLEALHGKTPDRTAPGPLDELMKTRRGRIGRNSYELGVGVFEAFRDFSVAMLLLMLVASGGTVILRWGNNINNFLTHPWYEQPLLLTAGFSVLVAGMQYAVSAEKAYIAAHRAQWKQEYDRNNALKVSKEKLLKAVQSDLENAGYYITSTDEKNFTFVTQRGVVMLLTDDDDQPVFSLNGSPLRDSYEDALTGTAQTMRTMFGDLINTIAPSVHRGALARTC